MQKVKGDKAHLEAEMKNLEEQVCVLTQEKEKLSIANQVTIPIYLQAILVLGTVFLLLQNVDRDFNNLPTVFLPAEINANFQLPEFFVSSASHPIHACMFPPFLTFTSAITFFLFTFLSCLQPWTQI